MRRRKAGERRSVKRSDCQYLARKEAGQLVADEGEFREEKDVASNN